MNPIFIMLETNLLASIEVILLLILLIAGVINYAKNPLIGLMIHFITSGMLFMFLWANGLNYGIALVCMFIFLVLMALALYAVGKSEAVGGLI